MLGFRGRAEGWLGYTGRDWHCYSVSSRCPRRSLHSPSLLCLLYADASRILPSPLSLGAMNLNARWTLPPARALHTPPRPRMFKAELVSSRSQAPPPPTPAVSHLPKPRAWGQAKETSSTLLSPLPWCSSFITFATCLPSFATIAALVDVFSFFVKNRLYL